MKKTVKKMGEIEKRYIRYRMRMDFLRMRLRWRI